MLPYLLISPLSKALKWLLWLISAVLVLLFGSLVSFNYMESEAESIRSEELNRIENDTISNEIAKKALTIGDIIAKPEKYQNQYVWVKGYLNLEFEDDAIYWRQLDYRNGKYRNAYWVEFSDSLLQAKRVTDYSKHYVVIKGIFDATRGGHGSLNSGAVTKISRLNSLQKSVK